MRQFLLRGALIGVGVLASPSAALAQGQVNGSGASLFVDFFRVPAAYNDFIDVDGDGVFGPATPGNPADPLVLPGEFDDLGPGLSQTWWVFQYRSVGSIEGYNEFVRYQLCGDLPESVPSERGIINAEDFAVTGNVVWIGPPGSCMDDTDGDGIASESGTPVCPERVDFANTDVETRWATQGPAGAPTWNRTPTAPGYGLNPNVSRGAAGQQGELNLLASLAIDCDGDGVIEPGEALNTNVESPDAHTVFDTTIAFSPVALIANRGLDIDHLSYTQLQYAFVTGRLPDGFNPAVAVRDVGSGTRNAWANPLGIDPSWCVGDHVGVRVDEAAFTNLGPQHQVGNCGGSSIIENAVQNRRIALGFTGLFGGSRAISDALGNRYEILGVIKDIDSDNDGQPDATQIVRPSLESVLFNANPETGYQIGGLQTIATVGNPNANRDPLDPLFEPSAPMANANAAAFINNIVSSIAEFEEPNDPGEITPQTAMPGELLATEFTLEAAVEATPVPTNPKRFQPNPRFNAALQAFIAAESTVPATPGYGAVGNGRVPIRAANPVFGDPNNPTATAYSDGSVSGNYVNYFTGSATIVGGNTLNARNRIAGDFDGDGDRDIDDIAGLMAAIDDPAAYATGAPGSTSGNPLVPEIVGDFNGDGNLDLEDARYFADGLAMVGGTLNRQVGFERADLGWQAATGDLNPFGTTLVTGKPYAAGDSRGDVAGAMGSGAAPTPGASPTGFDGVVDVADIEYICANSGDWTEIAQAVGMDLSCDMNGDLRVDADDIAVLVEDILGTSLGDADLDGSVGVSDLGVVLAHFGGPGGWAEGDFDCTGSVDVSDLGVVLSNFGQ